ncbi:MAG TPA: adenylate cyclase, partial [Armatimonadota bacterium]
MTNLELKVRCPDLGLVVDRALALGASDEGSLEQRDLYFVVLRGRLKLRLEGERAWLIQYQRPDEAGVRASSYSLVP